MMKKLSKIALLAAASAFMLAVFPACGDDDEEDDPSVKIVTNAESMTVEVDGTIDLMASVSDFPEGEVTYEWASDKTNFATVKQDPTNKAQAQVKAVAAGTAKITVTAKSGSTTATAEVTVTVKEGQISQPSVKIYNEAEQDITGKTDVAMKPEAVLNVMAIPSNFPEGDVTYEWVSGTATVAKVEQDPTNEAQARITALAEGTATITVTAKSGDTEKTATFTVNVTAEGGDQGTYANAVWNFTDAKYATAGLPTANGQIPDTSLAASSGSGATLSVTASKGYYRDNKCVHIDGGSNKTQTTPTSATGTFTLTLEKSAYVTVHLNGTGAARTDRWVVIADSNDKVLASTPADTGLDATERDLSTSKLDPGTYKIYANFARIFKITLSNTAN